MSRKRQYGSVEKRGVAQWRLNQIRSRRREKKPKEILWYRVPSGTECQIRRSGEPWRDYMTKIAFASHGYLWQNETHVGVVFDKYEIKLRKCDIEIGA